jgi:hypothetical protein
MGREDDPGRTQEIPFLDNRASGAKAHVCGWPLGSIGTFERVGVVLDAGVLAQLL